MPCTQKSKSLSGFHFFLDNSRYKVRQYSKDNGQNWTSLLNKGLINRGDSIRRRNSRSNSVTAAQFEAGATPLAGVGGGGNGGGGGGGPKDVIKPPTVEIGKSPSATPLPPLIVKIEHLSPPKTYRVALLGLQGVGKTALVNQFMTSECINVYERQTESVTFMAFHDGDSRKTLPAESSDRPNLLGRTQEDVHLDSIIQNPPDAFVFQYSVTDNNSLERVEDLLAHLQSWDLLRSRAAIVVGNKTDLVRSRSVSEQDGRGLAISYKTKFIEISVACNHNVDELLVGLIKQVNLHKDLKPTDSPRSGELHRRPTKLVRASRRIKRVFSRVWGKEEAKDCENLSVL
ncbi:unnamed protein product [Darwinula stevensoni]|uniref:Uncharacterized protein n=1 Tax=Darwinula stevensoni TaxID=69355 RepID=A0A7R8X5H1_9CRUS|nr:unnamed protein product [Darwinula stevensoni]CAG0878632.1 unnamed protein product [Darwinula stevensoni]